MLLPPDGVPGPRQCSSPVEPTRSANNTQHSLKVYSRRRRRVQATDAALDVGSNAAATLVTLDTTNAPSMQTSSSKKRASFMAKLSKKTVRILPTPAVKRTRSRIRTPAAPLRRSRIAGVGPEPTNGVASPRTKKKVMRALDIIGENEGIDEHALAEYTKLFTQPCQLSASHIQALAALFGWPTPVEDEVEVTM